MLEPQLQLGEGLRVHQPPQLRLPQQLRQQTPVQGQGLGPALGKRCVLLVEEGGYIGEDQGAGEGGGAARLHLMDADGAGADAGEDGSESRQVEDVRQGLPVGLHDHRKGRVTTHHREQALGPDALGPQGLAALGGPARGEQGAGGVLPEESGKQRRVRELLRYLLLNRLRVGQQVIQGRKLVAVCQTQHQAVVGVHHLDLEALPAPQVPLQGQGPGGMDTGPEGGEDA